MNRITTGLSALLLIVSTLPAAAQPRGVQVCGGDYVCTGDPSVVATWPLDRWTSVRRQQAASGVAPAAKQTARLGHAAHR